VALGRARSRLRPGVSPSQSGPRRVRPLDRADLQQAAQVEPAVSAQGRARWLIWSGETADCPIKSIATHEEKRQPRRQTLSVAASEQERRGQLQRMCPSPRAGWPCGSARECGSPPRPRQRRPSAGANPSTMVCGHPRDWPGCSFLTRPFRECSWAQQDGGVSRDWSPLSYHGVITKHFIAAPHKRRSHFNYMGTMKPKQTAPNPQKPCSSTLTFRIKKLRARC